MTLKKYYGEERTLTNFQNVILSFQTVVSRAELSLQKRLSPLDSFRRHMKITLDFQAI
jgi:hypothetical protein